MTSERYSLAPFEDLLADKLSEANEGKKLSPVGLISYAQGKGLILIGADSLKNIKAFNIDPSKLPNPGSLPGSEGRLVNMNRFDMVVVDEVPVGDIVYHSDTTIKEGNSFSLDFPYDYPGESTPREIPIGEEEILDTIIGRKGGIILFDSLETPEQTALVLERKIGEETRAAVLFFQRSLDIETSSSRGLHDFLFRLNSALIENVKDQKMQKIVTRLYTATILHQSFTAIEIFRSKILASCVDYERTHNPASREFLEMYFPKQGFFSKPDEIDITDVIDNLGIPEEKEKVEAKVEAKEVTKVEEKHVLELRTLDMIHLRHSIPDEYFGEPNSIMGLYLTQLRKRIGITHSTTELSDIVELLKELRNTNLGSGDFVYRNKESGEIKLWSYDDNYPSNANDDSSSDTGLIDSMIDEASQTKFTLENPTSKI